METGFRGAFVISWAQTEIDGQNNPGRQMLRIGVIWSWSGDFIRIDGPAEVLPLGEALGMTDLRRRAAAQLRKMLGALVPQAAEASVTAAAADDASFTVTDGRRTWTITTVETGPGRAPLLMFLGDVPPVGAELWVVSHSLEAVTGGARAPARGGVICFTPGTMILTDGGPVPVEMLSEGMLVQTKDNGCQPVLWAGRRRLSGARLVAMPHLAPVRFREGALDKGVPDTGLLVSPDHRLVLRGARARALFNADEVLVAARDLVDGAGIDVQRGLREVTYIHIMLPRHEIVFANSVETDSFHPASIALSTLEDGQRRDLGALLPEVEKDPQSYGGFSRRVLSQSEAAILRADAA
ncbi:MAG: Hint domain-containing protein [Rubellimicrobium sp.]|nr:Hint domain-containing protein [Rubellimicrobium sp.]